MWHKPTSGNSMKTIPMPVFQVHRKVSFLVIIYTIQSPIIRSDLKPLSAKPSVKEIQRSLWLIHGYHVTGTEDLEEREVATVLDLTIFVTVVKFDVLDLSLVESLLSWPLKSIGPSLVAEPVADEVGITSVDQDWDLLDNSWYKTVEWLHPIALEEKVSVDIEVAAVIAADLNTELSLDIRLVQEFADPAKSRVTKIA